MRDNLTKSDIEKMEAEIEHRKVVVRHELLEHVKTARAQGDLSENFEHYDHHDEKAYGEEESTYVFLKDVPIEFPHNQKVIRYDLSV